MHHTIHGGLTFMALALAGGATATQPPPPPSPYASIAHHQQLVDAGTLNSVQLTQLFTTRIQQLDRAGPTLRAVIEINPDAAALAAALDAARASTPSRSALYGMPVLLKDNIDTADRMHTTAGSLALTAAPAPRDAALVTRLRAAGAVILGKTNLSEWANFRSTRASSGWSGRGGQTHNPYVLDRSPCGSSSGSGAAVAAGLAVAAIGTETDGSIICPAAMNGIVGVKPTLGLVSRSGIVPISHSQDTAGPMARSVADAAALLTVIAGSDPRDAATRDADAHATDYTRFLDPNALRGKRIGVVRELAGYRKDVDQILDRSIATLRAAGAVVIDPVVVPHLNDYGAAEMTVLLYEFKHDLNAYLETRVGLPVHSLADLIVWNRAHTATEMPWFGQELFEQAQAKGPLTDDAYIKALEQSKRLSGPQGIDAALSANHLDALLAPTQGPAWTIDLVNGDREGHSAYSAAAVAGYPSITVPAGFVHGLPIGMLFFAGKWSEPTLFAIAYGFEQHTDAWQAPRFFDTAGGRPVSTEQP